MKTLGHSTDCALWAISSNIVVNVMYFLIKVHCLRETDTLWHCPLAIPFLITIAHFSAQWRLLRPIFCYSNQQPFVELTRRLKTPDSGFLIDQGFTSFVSGLFSMWLRELASNFCWTMSCSGCSRVSSRLHWSSVTTSSSLISRKLQESNTLVFYQITTWRSLYFHYSSWENKTK